MLTHKHELNKILKMFFQVSGNGCKAEAMILSCAQILVSEHHHHVKEASFLGERLVPRLQGNYKTKWKISCQKMSLIIKFRSAWLGSRSQYSNVHPGITAKALGRAQ